MKKMFIIALATLFSVSCGQVFDEYYQRVETTYPPEQETPEEPEEPVNPVNPGIDPDSYWYKAADSASMELLNRYWGPLLSRTTQRADELANWHFTAKQDYKNDDNNNYWHQPHALDAIIDAYNRTPSTPEYAEEKTAWLDVIKKWYQGVPRFQYQWNENWASNTWRNRYPWAPTGSAGGWRNHYIDDMAWMSLTQIRMYEALKDSEPALAAEYLAKAKEIYDDYIWTWAWDAPENDTDSDDLGLYQYMDSSFSMRSKNACINGPGMIIAAKLANYATSGSDRDKYIGQAEAIYEWMISHLYNPNGSVADNWNNGRSDGGALTYNQGTFLGGCHWLYKLTGNQDYLDDAVTTTNYTIERMQAAGEGGVMILNSESGATEGNNSMFRAIFLRYFVDIINESDVDVATRTVWYDNLKGWADYVWTDGKGIDKGTGITDPGEMLFGYDWKKLLTQDEIEAGVNLGNQASGAVLIEAMNIAKNPDSEDN